MAKGKEALQAERRKYEAALTHAQRLTDELVDYKLRTRACEADARRLPSLVAQIGHLQSLVDSNTSDEMERLRTAKDFEIHALKAENQKLREVFRTVIERAGKEGQTPFYTDEEFDFLSDRALVIEATNIPTNRSIRRMAAHGRQNNSTTIQDNRKSAQDNMMRARSGRGVEPLEICTIPGCGCTLGELSGMHHPSAVAEESR